MITFIQKDMHKRNCKVEKIYSQRRHERRRPSGVLFFKTECRSQNYTETNIEVSSDDDNGIVTKAM